MTDSAGTSLRAKPPARHRLRRAFSIARLRIRLGAYNSVQMAHARVLCAVVKARGLPIRALVILLATGMTESNIKVYANKWNPESLRLPHDAVGSDHGSVGIEQQQVCGAPYSTACWGTTEECMDPAHSAGSFLDRLVQFDWQAMTNWGAAQRVQGSFDPTGGNYKRNNAAALTLAAQLWQEEADVLLTDKMPNPNYPGKEMTVEDALRAVAVIELKQQQDAALLAKIAQKLGVES